MLGSCHKERASSTVSQLPSLMPSFFAPFTRRPYPPFVPPIQYPPGEPASGVFWYGTDELWTALSVDGKWKMGNYGKDSVYTTKLVFWGRGFDWRKEYEPKLIVTGTRLDGDAPSIAIAHANAAFVPGDRPGMMPPGMMTGLEVPTAGCWELTAHYRGHTLTFVVSVEP
jgi:hypothetical protein